MNINDINNLIVRFMAAESTLQKNRKEIIKNCEETKHECRMIGIKYGGFKEADEAIKKIEENTNAVLRAMIESKRCSIPSVPSSSPSSRKRVVKISLSLPKRLKKRSLSSIL